MEIVKKHKLERCDDNVNYSSMCARADINQLIEVIKGMNTSYKHFNFYDKHGFISYAGYIEYKNNFYHIKLKENTVFNPIDHEYKFYITKEEAIELYTAYKLIGDKFNSLDYIEVDVGGAF